jgi:hypothetical protein
MAPELPELFMLPGKERAAGLQGFPVAAFLDERDLLEEFVRDLRADPLPALDVARSVLPGPPTETSSSLPTPRGAEHRRAASNPGRELGIANGAAGFS